MPNTDQNPAIDDKMEELDGVLAELELSEETIEEEPMEMSEAELNDIEESEADMAEADAANNELSADAELDEEALEELELKVDKAESYAAQPGSDVNAGEGGIVTKGMSKPRAPSTPRAPRDMASVAAKHFVLSGDTSKMSDDDMQAAKDHVMANAPVQKKVAEKFEQVFQSMERGVAPSKYVMTIFEAMEVKNELSSAEIIAAFKVSGVGEGTARSQSGQIMVLFPVLGIADRDGKSLKLKADSNIAAYLRGLSAPAT